MAVYEGIKQITFGGNTYKLAGGSGGADTDSDGFVKGMGVITLNAGMTTENRQPAGNTLLSIPKLTEDRMSVTTVTGDDYVWYIGESAGFFSDTGSSSYSSYSAYNTVESLSFPKCYSIGANAFWNNIMLSSLSFPECRYIANGAFGGCHNLSIASFPKCRNIGSTAFTGCSSSFWIYVTSRSKSVQSYGTGLLRVSFPECITIEGGAFARCCDLHDLHFPKCQFVGSAAFTNCSSLSEVSFPECSILSNSAFTYCQSLSHVNLPKCKILGDYVFCFGGSSLTYVSLPMCSFIGYNAFSSAAISVASFPAVTTVSAFAFANCRALKSVFLPECLVLHGGAFQSCASLITIELPKCETISNSVFVYCSNLTTISLPNCKYISAGAFSDCVNLRSIYLLSTSVVTLPYSIAFTRTHIASSNVNASNFWASIYVPSSLLSAYKSATTWSLFSARFVGI